MSVEISKNGVVTMIVRSKNLGKLLYKNINRNKIDILFNSITNKTKLQTTTYTFTFFELFALEVYTIFKYLLTDEVEYGVDVVSIHKTLSDLESNTWIKNLVNIDNYEEIDNKLNYSKIKELMNFSILKHQEIAFKYYNNAKYNLGYNGGLLDMSVGSGKTFTSLAIAETIESDTVVIICPLATVHKVWEDSLLNTIYKKPQKVCIVKDGKYNKEKFIICHYEAMNKLMDFTKKLKGKITVIVDESHNFSDPKSDRTKLLKELLIELNTKDTIMMSGTPIKATAKEVINIMEIIDPKYNGYTKKRFDKLYKGMGSLLKYTLSVRYKAYSVKVTKEAFNLPTLTTTKLNIKLKNEEDYYISTIKKDIKKYAKMRMDYFNKNMDKYTNTYFELYNKAKIVGLANNIEPAYFSLYEEEVEKIRVLYKEKRLFDSSELLESVNTFEKKTINSYLYGEDKKLFREAKTVYKYVALKIVGETLANVIGKAREKCHVDLVNQLNFKNILNTTLAKSIIFTKYIAVANTAYDKLIEEKYIPLKVYGEDTKHLSTTISKFDKEEKYNPVIATYKSLSTGVPLIMANVMIGCDLPYGAYELEQAIARMVRLGQTRSCYFYYLSLDTDEEYNINNRNVDINKLNNEAVGEITGYKSHDYLNDESDNAIDIKDTLTVNKIVYIDSNNDSIIKTINDKLKQINIFY